MRAVIQRVSEAGVTVEGKVTGAIGKGLLVLLGVGHADTEATAQALAAKIVKLRIFSDAEGKMNLSVQDVAGGVLAVSQFTLLADTRKGNRPSFTDAAPPEKGNSLYEEFCRAVAGLGVPVAKGVFGAHMDVRLTNDGPVTIVMDM
jgi:D-tyrosyl-tRNA(Tyr) deacylase